MGDKTTREAVLERVLTREVRGAGGRCYKLSFPGVAGAPDRLVLINGHILFVEVKRDEGRVSAQQRKLHLEFKNCLVPVHIIRGMTGLEKFIKKWVDNDGGNSRK